MEPHRTKLTKGKRRLVPKLGAVGGVCLRDEVPELGRGAVVQDFKLFASVNDREPLAKAVYDLGF
jgi:hypothetical protein